jgi:plasmid stabilization system protein ParE
MAEVILSPEASADLNDILIYGLINHHEVTAAAYLRGFNAAFKRLEDYPFSGQIDEETVFADGITAVTGYSIVSIRKWF